MRLPTTISRNMVTPTDLVATVSPLLYPDSCSRLITRSPFFSAPSLSSLSWSPASFTWTSEIQPPRTRWVFSWKTSASTVPSSTKTCFPRMCPLSWLPLGSSKPLVLKTKQRFPFWRNWNRTRTLTNCYLRCNLAIWKTWTWSHCCSFSATSWKMKTFKIQSLKRVWTRS